jgi:hypothetical protein
MAKTIVFALSINAPQGLLWRFGIKLFGDSTFINGTKYAYHRCRSATARVMLDATQQPTHLLLHLRQSRATRARSARTDRVLVAKTAPNLISPNFAVREGQDYVLTLYHSNPQGPISATLVSIDTRLAISQHPMGFSIPISVREASYFNQLQLGVFYNISSPVVEVSRVEADVEFGTYDEYYGHLQSMNPDLPPLNAPLPIQDSAAARHEPTARAGLATPQDVADGQIAYLQSPQLLMWLVPLMQTLSQTRAQYSQAIVDFSAKEAEWERQVRDLTQQVQQLQERCRALERHPFQMEPQENVEDVNLGTTLLDWSQAD